MTLIQLKDVVKEYDHLRVLDHVSLDVEFGEILCLIGASGCGKSTLLRCINGLEKISHGEITFDGECVTSSGTDLNKLRQHIGIVFQGFNLFPHLTVLDNITLAQIKVLNISKTAAKKKAMDLLRRIGLDDKAKEYPDKLSGGQKQRAAIARALAMEPKVILLDEVTSALDPELVAEVMAIISELATDGMTMVIATHEMAFARDIANKVAFLDNGKIHEIGPPKQIFENPLKQRTAEFLKRIIAAGRL